MTLTTLGGLPQFLRLLATDPTPEAVMAALVAGPMSAWGGTAARFWLLDVGDLVHVGSSGYLSDEIDRYRILTPDLPFRVWKAVRERAIVATDADEARDTALEVVDRDYRTAMLERAAVECVVRSPLLQDGDAIGAVAVALRNPWPTDPDAAATLRGVAAALALWASGPNSRAQRVIADSRARARSIALVFSDRERDILRLVEARATTPAIAHALRVSESTVKAELQAAMRALSTNDRREAAARARALGLLD